MNHRKIMLNRCLAVMLILILGIMLLPTAETQAKTAKTAVNMKAKSVIRYMNSLDYHFEDEVYYNGKGDIPYFELNSRLTEVEECLNFFNPSGITLSSRPAVQHVRCAMRHLPADRFFRFQVRSVSASTRTVLSVI